MTLVIGLLDRPMTSVIGWASTRMTADTGEWEGQVQKYTDAEHISTCRMPLLNIFKGVGKGNGKTIPIVVEGKAVR
jgi:hypothetical protein